MKSEHYAILLDAMKTVAADIPAIRDAIKADRRVTDVEERVRWDILWATTRSQWISDTLYPYLNDDHIDTALKAIMRELEGK